MFYAREHGENGGNNVRLRGERPGRGDGFGGAGVGEREYEREYEGVGRGGEEEFVIMRRQYTARWVCEDNVRKFRRRCEWRSGWRSVFAGARLTFARCEAGEFVREIGDILRYTRRLQSRRRAYCC